MVWIFNTLGSLVVIEPPPERNYEPVTLDIPDLSGGNATIFMTRAEIHKKVIHSVQPTLNEEVYFFAFDARMQPIILHGICFNPNAQCDGVETSTGGNALLTWFDANHAFVGYIRLIEITYGDSVYTCLLTDIHIQEMLPNIPLYKFTLEVFPVSVE